MLGDKVEEALTAVGITSERVSKWVGKSEGCNNCEERKEKLNQLDLWVRASTRLTADKARYYLNKILRSEQ